MFRIGYLTELCVKWYHLNKILRKRKGWREMDKTATLVAMSGGVDSAAAALLCTRAGYACAGGTMLLHESDAAKRDRTDARRMAEALHIPFFEFDLTEEFLKQVIDPFVASYEAGFTPNPCLFCNRQLKFGALFSLAEASGYPFVATGHYARIEACQGRMLLKKGLDLAKDQSYVLYFLSQEQLRRVRFPLGEYRKEEIRRMAEEAGLVSARKSDSQDICFIPDGDYAGFIENHTGKTYPEGAFVNRDGTVLGTHKGLIRYTVGQRKGLGLALPSPLYVCEKQLDANRVVLCPNEGLFSRVVEAKESNWIACEPPTQPLRVWAKIRYRQVEQPATVVVTGEDTFRLEFDEPQRAVTPGQAVVLYDGDIVVGGGTIF